MSQRNRIFYSKNELLRYTSNLDIHKIWERIFRRAALPLAYSKGYHPQPRMNQACPLPLGITSQAEIIDVWFDEQLPGDKLSKTLEPTLHPGIDLRMIENVDLKAPALQTRVYAAEYQAVILDALSEKDLQTIVTQLLDSQHLLRQRRAREYDLRPLIISLSQLPSTDHNPVIHMHLTAREGATGRPDEVLRALHIDPADASLHRLALHFE